MDDGDDGPVTAKDLSTRDVTAALRKYYRRVTSNDCTATTGWNDVVELIPESTAVDAG